MKPIYSLLFFLFISSCASKKNKPTLTFLDEYVVPTKTTIKNSFIGGLSGIDYANGQFYMVVDDSKNPRFLTANISINQDTISAIKFTDVVFLNDTTQTFYTENALDLESIFVDEQTNEINFISEGSIRYKKNPLVFSTDIKGNLKRKYEVPSMFYAKSDAKPVHNATFEGSSKSVDQKGFWVAMEAPLQIDGVEATFKKTNSPIRITYYDKQSGKATKQFAYQLENITKKPKEKFNVNGVTALLEYEKNHFFVIERTYLSGYGSYGNIIRIFNVVIDDETTNVLNINSLKDTKYTPVKKELILNLADIQENLTDKIIDNIEGITFGPKLSNGKQSIIIISDDNFNKYDTQINQFILFEVGY